MKLLGMINVGFDVTDQLRIIFSAFIRYWRESLWFSEEEIIVRYSHRVWGTHETTQVDENVFKWN
jgi:hypothetical protein